MIATSDSSRSNFRTPRIVFLSTVGALAITLGYQFYFGTPQTNERHNYNNSPITVVETKNATNIISTKEIALFEKEKVVAEREKDVGKRGKKAPENETKIHIGNEKTREKGTTGNEKETKHFVAAVNVNININNTENNRTSLEPIDDAAWNRMTLIQQTQIQNYHNGQALILNIHVTHHGGTSFCSTIGRKGPSPSFACMGDKEVIFPSPPQDCQGADGDTNRTTCYSFHQMERFRPWSKSETGPFIEAIRPYFHMISWEFSGPKFYKPRTLESPDWGHPKLVSVVVTRDPLSRLLAGDGMATKRYTGYNTNELNRSRWWDYAAYDNLPNIDNFFLRILTSAHRSPSQQSIENHVEEGVERTTDEIMDLFPTGINKTHFEHGKTLLNKFTVVLDIACLTEGMEVLGRLLGLQPGQHNRGVIQIGAKNKSASPKDRIGYNDVYEYLLAKNQWDIALYKYSKTISLVQCDDLPY